MSFTVLHSSAGAGKTHALVKHYLTFCLKGEDPAAYRRVLALTFTNKAAAEMKERVIQYLDQLAVGNTSEARMADVMQHLVEQAGVDAAVISERAKRCLRHMLHHWSDVGMSTIDAFTRKVVRPFARDLKLEYDLQMTTEQDHYLGQAVNALIADAGVDPLTTVLLTEACLQLLHEERKWDPEKPLLELSKELVKENSIGPLQALGSVPPEQVIALASRLRTQEIQFRSRALTLGEMAMQLLASHQIAEADMTHSKNGIHGYFKNLAQFRDKWDEPGVQKLKPIETGKWHSGKASPEAIAALNGMADQLTTIFHHAEELRTTGYRNYTIQRAVARELMPAFALLAMNEKLEAIKHEDGVAFFSDLTRRVAEVVKDEPVPFIYERMGERYAHFLIDEFQDTSLLQWQALLPLIDNALSTGGSALLVGDAKQAIYRFRNGEVRLFAQFPKIYGNGESVLDKEREATLHRNYTSGDRLGTNRRSASSIVAFNNAVFGNLNAVLAEGLRPVYDQLEQECAHTEQGLTLIQNLSKELDSAEQREAILSFTLEKVNEALADGFAPGDIAILVRGGKLGKPVAAHLVANGHTVVSPDGLRLTGDQHIELIIDLVRFIHTSDVTAAARAMQYQAMSDAFKIAEKNSQGPLPLPDTVASIRKWLSGAGQPHLSTTIADLVSWLSRALGKQPAEDAPTLVLVDEAHAFGTRHGQDIGGFLEHWERIGKVRSFAPPASGHAIQVMSVHRSKGLQFPVVIVPDANMTTQGGRGERIWIDPENALPDVPIALVRSSATLKAVDIPELQEEAELTTLDALNLVYVAFTRPEQRLYALVPEYRADDVTKQLLTFIEENGQNGKLQDGERQGPWEKRTYALPNVITDVADQGQRVLQIRLEAPPEWDPADPDPFRSHGNAVHDLLARIDTADDLDQALSDAIAEGALANENAKVLKAQLTDVLSSPEMQPWFGKGLSVKNEATIVNDLGNALRPDRLVFDGEVVRVLDIKTGGALPDHHDQVRSYMQHIAELGHPIVEGALFYVRDGSIQTVTL